MYLDINNVFYLNNSYLNSKGDHMKNNYIKNKLYILTLLSLMLLMQSCKKPISHSKGFNSNLKKVSVKDTLKKNKDKKDNKDKTKEQSKDNTPLVKGTNVPKVDYYPYDNKKDRKKTDLSKIDVPVYDTFYMTQINDWFMNFKEYEGKTVSIEGYYMTFNGYNFIGRSGPTCPYCTGGYVNFEFQTDEDISKLKHLSTWISIKGILRKGKSTLTNGKSAPFYYIETLELNIMPHAGVNPIKN